ncbi:hypothetical protein ACHAWF_018024 [Thalassiosira exigua]
MRPFVATLHAKPTKTKLLLGPVTENVSKERLPTKLREANARIRALEQHISGERQFLEGLHGNFDRTVESGWDCIEAQAYHLADLGSKLAAKTEELQEKTIQLIRWEGKDEVWKETAKTHRFALDTKDAEIKVLQDVLAKAKKEKHGLTCDEQIRLDNAKTANAMDIAKCREEAKERAREEMQERKKQREADRFKDSQKNYNEKGPGLEPAKRASSQTEAAVTVVTVGTGTGAGIGIGTSVLIVAAVAVASAVLSVAADAVTSGIAAAAVRAAAARQSKLSVAAAAAAVVPLRQRVTRRRTHFGLEANQR